MAAYYVPVLFIKINICQPISGYWDSSIQSKCLSQRAVFVADTVVSAVTDLAVLLAPVPVIRALTMSFRQKVRVYLLLGAGGVATIASFIRMYLVIKLQQSEDQTVDFVRFNLLGYENSQTHTPWPLILLTPHHSTAEVSIGLICACMPTINLALQSRHSSDKDRHRPRSRNFGIHTPRFLKRRDGKRQWWSDGTTLTQNTQPDEAGGLEAGAGALHTNSKSQVELTSMLPTATAGTNKRQSKTVLWEYHASAIRAVAQPPTTPRSPTQRSSRTSHGRYSSWTPLTISPPQSREHSPSRMEERGKQEVETTYLSSPTVSVVTPGSPGEPEIAPARDSLTYLDPPPILRPPPWHRPN